MRYYEAFPPYVPVAQRRARAEKQLRQMQKKHPHLKPVILPGQALATTWWGKSWNHNLERYADYSNRIGRGRSYVRHRAVLDLQLSAGKATALVQGSMAQPYKITITIDPLSAGHWKAIRAACEGHFDSLSELLAGKFPQALKDLFFAQGAGLFPAPRDIHFDCSCPDWASMCKHVAAALYGIGARLDEEPALFFTLRAINMDDLITQTVTTAAQTLLDKAGRQSQNILQDVDLGDVFGIQLDEIVTPRQATPVATPSRPALPKPAPAARKTAARQRATPASRQTPPARQARAPRPPAAPGKTARTVAPTTRPGRQKAVPVVPTPPPPPQGTMLEALLKAVGTARAGKSVEQLQTRLGWTRIQVRNTLRRASAKGLLETVGNDRYRRKV